MTENSDKTFDQLYCTHCTWGTSAQHRRRDSAMEAQPFEYSTRAGSVPQAKSHDTFRLIEPYMYYHLPADTPNDVLLQEETRKKAPKRLLFLPSVSGKQVLAQVSYRLTDTRNRPASYFAHVLLRDIESGGPRWTAAECCKMWGTDAWVDQDGDHDFDLEPVPSLRKFRKNQDVISDEVLRDFLTAPTNGPFKDPGKVIPNRWRAMSPTDRQKLLIDTLNGLLQLTGRETVTLAIEPSLAALVFYGVLRLLPEEGLAETVSFSTFESHADRPSTTLTATTFRDESKCQLPREFYNRGFVLNTYDGQSSPSKGPESIYAKTLVKFFASEGAVATNELRAKMKQAEAKSLAELDDFAKAQALISRLEKPDPKNLVTQDQFPKDEKGLTFLREQLGERLAKLPPGSAKVMLDPPSHAILLLKLIAGQHKVPAAENFINELIAELPQEQVAQLSGQGVSADFVVTAIVKHIETNQKFPEPQDAYWAQPIVNSVATQLSDKNLRAFVEGVQTSAPANRLRMLCLGLISACEKDAEKKEILCNFLSSPAISNPSNGSSKGFRYDWLNSPEMRPGILKFDSSVTPYLGGLLEELPKLKTQFASQLGLLNHCRARVHPDIRTQLDGWLEFQQALSQLAAVQKEKPGFMERVNHNHANAMQAAAKTVGEASIKAIPHTAMNKDDRANWLCLLVAANGSLPESFRNNLDGFLAGRGWGNGKMPTFPTAVGPKPPAPPASPAPPPPPPPPGSKGPAGPTQSAPAQGAQAPVINTDASPAQPAKKSKGLQTALTVLVVILLLGVGIYLGTGVGGGRPGVIETAEAETTEEPEVSRAITTVPRPADRFDSPEIAAVTPTKPPPEERVEPEPTAPVAIKGDGVLRALKFSGGKDEYVVLKGATEKFELNQDFTIEMWVKFADPKTKQPQFLAGNQARNGFEFNREGARDEGWAIELTNNGGPKLEFRAHEENGGTFTLTSNVMELSNAWTHLAVVRRGQYITLLGNGKQIAQKTHPPTASLFAAGTRDIFLGGAKATIPGNKQFSGEMRGFQIASNARYKEDFVPPESLTNDDNSIVLLNFRSGPDPKIGNEKSPNILGELAKVKWVDLDTEIAATTTTDPENRTPDKTPEPEIEEKPIFPFRSGRRDQHVAEYFYELPPIPESMELEAGPTESKYLPKAKDVTRLTLHGLEDLNQLLKSDDKFKTRKFTTWVNLPKKTLEVYLAETETGNDKPTGPLLGVFVGQNNKVVFQWRFVENETIRKNWQPLLKHCILEFRDDGYKPNESTPEGIALHRPPNQIARITIQPDKDLALPKIEFPDPFHLYQGKLTLLIGCGLVTWDKDTQIPFGTDHLCRFTQYVNLKEKYGGLKQLNVLIDDSSMRTSILPTKTSLDTELRSKTGPLKKDAADLEGLLKTYNNAKGKNLILAAATRIAIRMGMSFSDDNQRDLVVNAAKREEENLRKKISEFEALYSKHKDDVDAANNKEYPISTIIYRVVDGPEISSTLGECWLDPVLIIGHPEEAVAE